MPLPSPKPEAPKPHCPVHGVIISTTGLVEITYGGLKEQYCPRCYQEFIARQIRANCQPITMK